MLNLSTTPIRIEPLNVLMCTPNFYDIVDIKNLHMQGNIGTLDKEKAKQQWQSIFDIYQNQANTGNIDGITQIKGIQGCEDMVFCANQSFPWIDNEGNRFVIMSRMKYPSRQNEIEYFEMYYEQKEYDIYDAPGEGLLEGMGDLIPFPGKQLVFGGYGHRTDYTTLELVSQILDCYLIALELVNESFYHLDTCFIPLNEKTVLIAKEAFSAEGLAKINKYFSEVIEIPYQEASQGFALNAHIVNGYQYPFAIIQKNNVFTSNVLTEKGFMVFEVDTSEFMKSGGSVFCMKMMHY